MRIMHVIDSLGLGGAERMLVEIANRTQPPFHPLVCVTRSGTEMASRLRPDIACHGLDRIGRFDLKGLQRFSRLVRAADVDLLHVHGRTSFSFVALARFLGLIRAPILLHDHYGKIEIDPTVPAWFRYWGKYQLASYVGVCEKGRQWASCAGIDKCKISVIPNAVDPSRFDSLGDLQRIEQPSMLTGIMICGIRYEKGLDSVIDIAASLPSKNNLKILVVGDIKDEAYFRGCMQKIQKLGLESVFGFLGPRQDIPDLLRKANFALLPSRSESGPLVMIEYLASGLPVVGFMTGEITRRAHGMGISGIVPSGDTKAFTIELIRLLALSSGEMRARGVISKEMAWKAFHIDNQMPRWYAVYAEALKQ